MDGVCTKCALVVQRAIRLVLAVAVAMVHFVWLDTAGQQRAIFSEPPTVPVAQHVSLVLAGTRDRFGVQRTKRVWSTQTVVDPTSFVLSGCAIPSIATALAQDVHLVRAVRVHTLPVLLRRARTYHNVQVARFVTGVIVRPSRFHLLAHSLLTALYAPLCPLYALCFLYFRHVLRCL